MAAFKLGEWNRYEIECIGPRVRTRVNGVACAEWYDGIVSGLLAFQVHGGKACEVAFRAPAFEDLGASEGDDDLGGRGVGGEGGGGLVESGEGVVWFTGFGHEDG